jgi:hypothetical protein
MTVIVTPENRHLYAEALFDPKKRSDPGTDWTAGRRADMEEQLAQADAERAVTILNLNPFPLKINGGVFFPEEIAACPLDQPYTIHVLNQTRWGHRDIGSDAQGMLQMEPFAAIPMVLAAEYVREYSQQDGGFGGVLAFLGEEDPRQFPKDKMVRVPEIAFNSRGRMYVNLTHRNFHEVLERLVMRRNQSIMRKLEQANSWHENPDQRLNINDTHRDMARMALKAGLIDRLPTWTLQESTAMQKTAEPCPSCQVTPKPGAVICVNCEHVFDIIKAFQLTRIAYGSVEMERLTAEEWKVVDKIQAERVKARGKRAPVADPDVQQP